MRKYIWILIALAFVLFMVNNAMALGDYHDNRRNYNHHNTIDSPSADADASASVHNSNTNVNANINENNNRNTNVNFNNAEGGDATIEEGAVQNDNTNEQKQQQGQIQGQLQGQMQGQSQENVGNNVGNSDVSITQNYEDKREFLGAPDLQHAGGPAEFNADPGKFHQYMNIETVIQGKRVWTASQIAGLIHPEELDDISYDIRHFSKSRKEVDQVELTMTKPENSRMLAIVKVWFEKPVFGENDNDSMGCIALAMKKAVEEIEGSKVVAVGQGARKVLTHFQWAIGPSWGGSTVNGDSANSGSAGIGVSGGEVGYTIEPFVRFFIYE